MHNSKDVPQQLRKCQECGHRQFTSTPPKDQTKYSAWAEFLCRKCKSPALDFGIHVKGRSDA